jgi:short-subunit dehydrogenase
LHAINWEMAAVLYARIALGTAVLPAMRRQRHGHIINIGSLAGVSSIPFLGMYCASKFALQGYTEALRHEVKTFNQAVRAISR